MTSLREARALITGGAQGIGFALAQQLAAVGAEVILTDIDDETLDNASDAIRREGGQCASYKLDITDLEAILIIREAIMSEHGPINVLVNNAGLAFSGSFLEVPVEQHLRTYKVNIEGVVAVTHAFLPQMLESARAHLVNIASAAGFIPLPKASTYASTKWAIVGFSESIRRELELLGHGHVGVTTVCPSFVATQMFSGITPPLLTKILSPQELALKVVEAVETDKVMLLEPWLVKLTPFLMGAFPRRVTDRLSDILGLSTVIDTWRRQGRQDG